MKKAICSFIFISLFSLMTHAQDEEVERNNIVKINPLGLIIGNATISYERVINEHSTFQVNGNYGGLSLAGAKYRAYGASVDYRYYVSQNRTAPKGFYLSPGIGFTSVTVSVNTGTAINSASGSGAVLKGLVGNQWVRPGGFSIDVFAGLNLYAIGSINISGFNYAKYSGVLPAFGVSLGYCF